ncbi:MAG: hypothetical protein NTZ72_07545 [Afipia sp.]|jgi:hypothetical protein|nr:hypothetical protein [Afipia sp.]
MRVVPTTLLISLALITAAHAAPPKQLYGKSITVSWTETRSQRDSQAGPTFKQVGIPFTNVYYISTEGRLFKRASARSPGGAGSVDRVGTSGGSESGDSRNVSFSGNRIVASNSFQGAARQTQITFDPSFSSCTAQVITGMPPGRKSVTVRSITTGNTVEFESVSAGPASCSIASGNPF